MAFTLQTWGRASVSANEPISTLQDASVIGAPRIYTYDSADTQATIAASGYFNLAVANQGVAPDLVTGDIIMVYSSSDGTWIWYSVTNTAGVITTAVFSSAGTVGTSNITNNAVTYAKIQTMVANSLLGNPTGGTLTPQAITLGNGLENSGTTLRVPLNVAVSASVVITAAEWNGMYAAPKALVAAGGANTMIVLDSAQFSVNYGGAQFASGGAAAIQYASTANGAGTLASGSIAAATINGVAADSSFVLIPAAVTATANASVVNQGLYMSNLTGAFTTGSSDITVNLRYRVVATPA